LIRRGGIGYVREASPLFNSPYSEAVIKEVLEGLRPSKEITFPLPLNKGKGDKGG